MALSHILIKSDGPQKHEAYEVEDTKKEMQVLTWNGTLESFEQRIRREYKHRRNLTIKHVDKRPERAQLVFLVEGNAIQRNQRGCYFSQYVTAPTEDEAKESLKASLQATGHKKISFVKCECKGQEA